MTCGVDQRKATGAMFPLRFRTVRLAEQLIQVVLRVENEWGLTGDLLFESQPRGGGGKESGGQTVHLEHTQN